jgi:hypothetical protein
MAQDGDTPQDVFIRRCLGMPDRAALPRDDRGRAAAESDPGTLPRELIHYRVRSVDGQPGTVVRAVLSRR